MHSGRWVEVFIPTADGSKHFGAANLYGHAGATTDGQLRRLNEIMLKFSIARMTAFNDVPYYLGMDLNMNPETSENLTTGRTEGLIYDIIPDWTHGEFQPLGTYKSGGVNCFMDILKGNGVTRIDTVIANTVGAHAVDGIMYQWELSQGMDHVGVTVSTNQEQYNEKVTKYIQPHPITLPNGHPCYKKRNEQAKKHIADNFNQSWDDTHETQFNERLNCNDIEGAARLWHDACEKVLIHAFNVTEGQDIPHKPKRGTHP
jgi:hypothetical protein